MKVSGRVTNSNSFCKPKKVEPCGEQQLVDEMVTGLRIQYNTNEPRLSKTQENWNPQDEHFQLQVDDLRLY